MVHHYLLVSLRNLQRKPFATAINVFALALGLSCFVAAYATVLYWGDAERHFALREHAYAITQSVSLRDGSIATGAVPLTSTVVANYLRLDFPELSSVARAQPAADVSVSTGERKARVQLAYVDAQFLDIFDIPFSAGSRSTALQQPNSVVISEATALQLYGTKDPVGRFLRISRDIEASITGVFTDLEQPSHMGTTATSFLRFQLLVSWDVIERLQAAGRRNNAPENWVNASCVTYALLPKDAALDEAEFRERLGRFADLRVPSEQRERVDILFDAVPVGTLMVAGIDSLLFANNDTGVSITQLLLFVGGLVLLIAALNYASLAASHVTARVNELGMRRVVGAKPSQLLSQYLIEAAVLTTVALAVSLLVMFVTAPFVKAYAEVDLRLALSSGRFWALGITLVALLSLVAGAYPALLASRMRPVAALGRVRQHAGSRRLLTVFGGAQFAAASFLAIVVVAMLNQSHDLRQTSLQAGLDPLVVITNVSFLTKVDPESFHDDLLRITNVRAVSSINTLPWTNNLAVANFQRTIEESATTKVAYQNVVGYEFFETIGAKLLAGRYFDRSRGTDVFQRPSDNPADRNIIVDRAFVEQLGFVSPSAAIGEVIYMPPLVNSGVALPATIIGVIENHPLHLFGLGATSNVYFLLPNQSYVIARIAPGNIAETRAAIEAAWDRQAPNIAMSFAYMDTLFDENYKTLSRVNRAFGGLAALALAISGLGLFGMAVYTTERRLHEIGVRKTLGAKTWQIGAMLIADCSTPVLLASLVSWPLGFLAVEAYLRVFLHRSPISAFPFLSSLALCLLIAGVAVFRQSMRAAHAKPSQILHESA